MKPFRPDSTQRKPGPGRSASPSFVFTRMTLVYSPVSGGAKRIRQSGPPVTSSSSTSRSRPPTFSFASLRS